MGFTAEDKRTPMISGKCFDHRKGRPMCRIQYGPGIWLVAGVMRVLSADSLTHHQPHTQANKHILKEGSLTGEMKPSNGV